MQFGIHQRCDTGVNVVVCTVCSKYAHNNTIILLSYYDICLLIACMYICRSKFKILKLLSHTELCSSNLIKT